MNDNTIFLVSRGEGANYVAEAIFNNKDLAREYINKFESRFNVYNPIEERELNPFGKYLRDDFNPYIVRLCEDGSLYSINHNPLPDEIKGDRGDGKYLSFVKILDNVLDEEASKIMICKCFAKNQRWAINFAQKQREWVVDEGRWGEDLLLCRTQDELYHLPNFINKVVPE